MRLVLLALLAGCGGSIQFHAKALQPRVDEGGVTGRLFIRVQYLHLQDRVVLEHSARLRASGDGLFADATLMHVWQDRVDCAGRSATLVDGGGARHAGELVHARRQRIFIDGDRYLREDVNPDARRHQALVATCSFHFRETALAEARSLTLVLSGEDGELRYTWTFRPGKTRLSHFGPPRAREDAAFYDP